MKPKRLNSTAKLSKHSTLRSMSNHALKSSKSNKSQTMQIPKNPSLLLKPESPSNILEKPGKSKKKSKKLLLKPSLHLFDFTQRSALGSYSGTQEKLKKNLSQPVRNSPKSNRNHSATFESKPQNSRKKSGKTLQTPKQGRPPLSENTSKKLKNILQKFIQFKEAHYSIVNDYK